MMIDIYTDGACQGNPGPGGWAAVVVDGGKKSELKGSEAQTTSNRMELAAAIEALSRTPEGSEVAVHSDSEYLVKTMTKGWKRSANTDLWGELDRLSSARRVRWEWIRGHAGHPENERANLLAEEMAGVKNRASAPAPGGVRMVDISSKAETERVSVARGVVVMSPPTLDLIKRGGIEKGDVLSLARVAGIMAAKKTPDIVPLCHPLLLDEVAVELSLDRGKSAVQITASAKTTGKTGVEMEALVAVSAAALTIYDMCKPVDPAMRIEGIRLVRKSGGKSGEVVLE